VAPCTVQTEMSLATAGIHCTISQRLSGATEDCSIVRGRQLRMRSINLLFTFSFHLHLYLPINCLCSEWFQ